MQKSTLNLHHSLELQFAIDVVSKASQITQAVQSEMTSSFTLTKSDRSPVTVADLAAQAVIAYFLGKVFPDDPLVAEEDSKLLKAPEGQALLQQVTTYAHRFIPDATPENICHWIDRGTNDIAQRYWTLDPVDGTKGFLRGDQYAIALALIVDGEIKIGVLGCPHLKESKEPCPKGPGSLVFASRGNGAWTLPLQGPGQKKRLQVSRKTNPAGATLLRSFDATHTHTDQIDEIRHHLKIETPIFLMDSLAKYAVLAAGRADLYLRLLAPDQRDYHEFIWDQAAGAIILEEAGGKITDLDGRSLDFTVGRKLIYNRGILASNGRLHEIALAALTKLKI